MLLCCAHNTQGIQHLSLISCLLPLTRLISRLASTAQHVEHAWHNVPAFLFGIVNPPHLLNGSLGTQNPKEILPNPSTSRPSGSLPSYFSFDFCAYLLLHLLSLQTHSVDQLQAVPIQEHKKRRWCGPLTSSSRGTGAPPGPTTAAV